MRKGTLETLLRYALAALSVALVLEVKLIADPVIGKDSPFLLFFIAIGLSAWFGGFGPGFTATLLSALASAYYFLFPLGLTDLTGPESYVRLALFTSEALLISWLAQSMRAARHRAETAVSDLRLELSRQTQAANGLRAANAGLEKRMAERTAELARSEEARHLYNELLMQMPDAVLVTDLEGNILQWLGRAERVFGYSSAEAVGRPLSLLHPPEFKPGVVEKIIESARETGEFSGETLCKRKDGTDVLIETTVRALYRKNNPAFLVLIDRDVTERKRVEEKLKKIETHLGETEEALLAAEAKFRWLVESTPDAVVIVDRDGRIARVNPQTERMFGYKRGELLGKSIETLIPERFRKSHVGHRSRYAAKPEIRPMGIGLDLSACRKDGTEFPVEITLSPADASEGFLVMSIVRDITERKKAEAEHVRLIGEQATRAEAEAAERRAAFLAETSRILASSLDYTTTLTSLARAVVPFHADWCTVDLLKKDGTIKHLAAAHVNPAKVELFQELRRRYPPRPSDTHGVPTVLRTGQPEIVPEIPDSLLADLAHNDQHLGVLRTLELISYVCVPLLVRGKPIGAMTFMNAESGRRYGQKDLFIAEDLARRAAAAIDNAFAYQEAQAARGEAEEANRGKDEFLAILSHELRTPLNAILGWSRLLSQRTLNREASTAAIESIERNAKVQSQLIEDLLDVSRIITGKLQLDVREVDLIPVIRAALSVVRPAAEAKGVRVQTQFDPKAGPVLGDANRVQQVVWNLLSNAIKFTPEGGRVEIRLEQIGAQARILVSDSGQGISPEFLPHVFERFRQADSTSKRTHGGLGLGLSIVRHLVELQGGTVRAESPGEGKGATFIVTLPVRAVKMKAQSPEKEELRVEFRVSSDGAKSLKGLSILVVDDEADARALLTAVLSQEGADVTAVASVKEALAVLQQSKPDVLLSDIAMPGEDGYSLIHQVRTLEGESGARIPAAALTAYAREKDRERVLSAGFQIHVTKPVEPSELVAAVASLVGRAGSDVGSAIAAP
jgi:PAS domain S-box-containing protein